MSAVTISAPNFAPDEIRYAQELCKRKGYAILSWSWERKFFPPFPITRRIAVIFAKKALFGKVVDEMRARLPGVVIADGTNLDDVSDYRPGRKALEELSIASPLKEAGLTKRSPQRAEGTGRRYLGQARLCLPRFAYSLRRDHYERKTDGNLPGENLFLQDLGFRQVRVRHHGTLARIEVLPEARGDFFDLGLMDLVNERLKEFGFLYVTLDLAGYRMGSLNEEIEE